MLSFIRSFESSAFSVGTAIATVGSAGGTRTRVIRQTSHGSIDRLIAALRTARADRDLARADAAALRMENARLRREAAIAQATLAASRALTR